MPFACSICEEESTQICVYCTKDTCGNHLCDRCHRCSDCCECEVALVQHAPEPILRAPEPPPSPDPDPDPDPFPEPAQEPAPGSPVV